MRPSILAAALAILGTWPAVPGRVAAQVSEGVSVAEQRLELGELLALAEARSPMLRAFRSAAIAAAEREPEASTLPDPMIEIGVMNFGLPSFGTGMPTSMAPSIQLKQMIPFPGKLGLMGDVASYSREIAEADALEGAWNVRADVASHFFELYTTDRTLDVMLGTLSLLRYSQDVARAMYVAGTGRQTDVLRADVEIARMDAEIYRMEAMRTSLAARINAMLDRSATTEVPSPTLGELPLDLPDRQTLLAWAHESRPRIARHRMAVARAQAALGLARREIWPDVTVGLTYGQRNVGMGTERMGSAMIEFSLPIHADRRQLAMRREASAMEEMAEADLAGAFASVDANLGVLLAELERARRLVALYRDEVIPETRATVESAFSSYRVGSVDFMTLVDAQMTLNRYQAEFFQHLGDYGRGIAAIESEVGQELPRGGPMLRELP